MSEKKKKRDLTIDQTSITTLKENKKSSTQTISPTTVLQTHELTHDTNTFRCSNCYDDKGNKFFGWKCSTGERQFQSDEYEIIAACGRKFCFNCMYFCYKNV